MSGPTPDSSGPHNRVVDVINYLAAHPTESFTLSELAARLSISHGSAHRVLKVLTEARYLSRHAKHKTYSLGLALVAIGQAALEKHRVVDIAHREAARLASELGVQCIAAAVVDDEMLFVARDGVTQTDDGLTRVGERRPFLPPLGLGHVAWGGPEVLGNYLARAPFAIDADMRAHLVESCALIRTRGYAVAANGPALKRLRRVSINYMEHHQDAEYWAQIQELFRSLSKDEIQLKSVEDVGSAQIAHLSAPVFSAAGTVILELSLTGIHDNLSVAEVKRYAERLCAAAAVVTSETHGRAPRI